MFKRRSVVRVGVIGTGNMGKHHVRVYSGMDNVELVGIADINRARVRHLASLYNTKAYTSYHELIRRERPDAVSIAVPTTMHKDVALDIIASGIHALIEKPIADSLKAADEIIEAADKEDVRVMIGHIERFNPVVEALKDIMPELGEILTISSKRLGPYPPSIKDVGVILDLAVHDIDVISVLYGKHVISVNAFAGNSFRNSNRHDLEDYATVVLRYEGGNIGVVETNWLTPRKVRTLMIVGTEAVAHADYITQNAEVWKHECTITVSVDRQEPLKNELESFIRCVSTRAKPHPSAEDGKKVLAVAIAAINSYKKQEEVRINDILS